MRSLPKVVSAIPNDLRAFVDRVREYLGEGSGDRFVTLNELRKGGIVGTTPGGTIIPPGNTGVENPTVPTGLTATGAFAVIFLEWTPPNYLGHAYTEVWAADTDDFAAKTLVGTTSANVFGHEIGTGASKYYWIRFVNALGTEGPFNGTPGTYGATSQNPDYLIDVLSDAYGVTGPAPFFQVDTPTVINGVTIPAGTYIKQAWIADATISRAKIQDLAVDDAKINDLAVNKLTAGTMQVGSYIQSQSYVAGTSGWKINSDGTAEFANGVFRGNIYGSGASSYAVGAGLFSGTDTLVVSTLTRSSTTATLTTSTAHGLSIGSTFTLSGVTNDTGWNGTYTVATVPSTTQVTFTVSNTRTTPATGTMRISVPYRFRVGDPAGNQFTWDGTTLKVTGTISGSAISGSSFQSGSATAYMTGAGFWASGSQWRVGDPAGSYMRWTGSALEINGAIVGTTNIATNVVSQTKIATNGSRVNFTSTTENTVATTASMVVPASNTGVLVNYSLGFFVDTSSNFGMTLRVYRDTTLLDSIYIRIKAGVDQVVSRIAVDDAPTSGTYTYKVTAQCDGSPGAGNLYIETGVGIVVATLLKR